MTKWITSLIFWIRYKLGLAREGVDFITPGMEDNTDVQSLLQVRAV